MSTIRQVAEKAGVSTSTVSRYISQNGYVSQKASQKNRASYPRTPLCSKFPCTISENQKKINLLDYYFPIFQTLSFQDLLEELKNF